MTAEEIYESVTNGGSGDFAEAAAIFDRTGRWCLVGGLAINCYVEPVKKDELDLMRIAEAYPELRSLIPSDIVSQLGGL